MDGSGAEYLASIFGTEKDKVNCSFYYKMGACRHGDRCSRVHNRPTFSQTILLQNMYQNPSLTNVDEHGNINPLSDIQLQEHYDSFFEEIYTELEEKYGDIEEMNVCDNLGDHLVGNVYIKFKDEGSSEKAVPELNNRWFDSRPIYAELSPVADFREACCRQYELGECNRGGFCNFMHLKPISRELRKELYKRNKHKKAEDREFRDETQGGKLGGYAGGFGGWSGVGDTFDDKDYGYYGRASTQFGSEKKMRKIDKVQGRSSRRTDGRDKYGGPAQPGQFGGYSAGGGGGHHQQQQGGYDQGGYNQGGHHQGGHHYAPHSGANY